MCDCVEIECLVPFSGGNTSLVVSACLGGQLRVWDVEASRCIDGKKTEGGVGRMLENN